MIQFVFIKNRKCICKLGSESKKEAAHHIRALREVDLKKLVQNDRLTLPVNAHLHTPTRLEKSFVVEVFSL